MSSISHDDGSHDCHGCSLHDALAAPAAVERRAFLRAAGMALAALGLATIDAERAAAMRLHTLTALAPDPTRPDERRYPIPPTDGVSIDKENGVIIARASGKVYAFSLACPHQNTALRWEAEDREFRCPKHKSRYKDDGTFIDGRATRSMDRLPLRRDGELLVVDVDRMYKQNENPVEWANAFVAVWKAVPF